MANKHPKVQANPIRIRWCRPAFWQLDELKVPTDQRGQPRANAKPRATVTLLLDPTRKDCQEDYEAFKAEAARVMDLYWEGRANWPKADPRTGLGAPIWCWGNGNDLKKIYNGFKDMWYIKVSDTALPILGAIDAREVRKLADGWHYCDANHAVTEEKADQNICPYAGCIARARISPYPFDNQSTGVNANILSLQFVAKGDRFDGRAPANAADEFEAQYQEYAAQQAVATKDPFG